MTRSKPAKIVKNKTDIVSFLPQRDISYCSPGRKDTVYCGKSVEGEKTYHARHHLLVIIKECVEYYNAERRGNDKITFY